MSTKTRRYTTSKAGGARAPLRKREKLRKHEKPELPPRTQQGGGRGENVSLKGRTQKSYGPMAQHEAVLPRSSPGSERGGDRQDGKKQISRYSAFPVSHTSSPITQTRPGTERGGRWTKQEIPKTDLDLKVQKNT